MKWKAVPYGLSLVSVLYSVTLVQIARLAIISPFQQGEINTLGLCPNIIRSQCRTPAVTQ